MSFYEDYQTLIEEEEKRKTSLNSMVGSDFSRYFGADTIESPYAAAFEKPVVETPVDERGAIQYAINETIGAGLWGFLESGTLADIWVPKEAREAFAILEEEPETFIGKSAAALGHLGGFVMGAPMKAIGKPIMAGLTRLAARKVIKEGGEDLAQRYVAQTAKNRGRAIVEAATQSGIKKELAEDMVIGFKNIAGKSMLNKNIGKNFTKHMDDAVDNLSDYYVKMGEIGGKESVAFRDFFKVAFRKQPIQTFGDVAVMRGKSARWGNLMHEALMFTAIDGVLEVPRAIHEDRDYNWTAPLWGTFVGAGFGGLKFLKPKGKAASFRKEIVDGIKAYMGKNPYLEKSAAILAKHANFIGQSMDDVGVATRRDGTLGAKQYSFDFKNPHAGTELIAEFGEVGAKDILARELNVVKQNYGRQLINWAAKEEWSHLREVFPRMIAGSIIMNASSIYDIAFNDADMTVEDMLPSIFIGAGLQHRGLPRKWDLNTRVKKIRGGLKFLGADVRNLQRVPSFENAVMSHMNPMNTKEEFRSIRDMAEERGIIGNDWDFIRVKSLPGGEESVLGAEAAGKDLTVFNSIYRMLRGSGKFVRDIDDISVKDAEAIQKQAMKYKFDELGGDFIQTSRDFDIVVDKVNEGAADRFENLMVDALIQIGSATEHSLNRSKATMGRMPRTIRFSRELELKARDGELEWLLDAEGNTLSGADALVALDNAKYKAGSVIGLFKSDGIARIERSHQDYKVETEEALKVIYESVTKLEDRINQDSGIKDDLRFDLVNDMDNIAQPMVIRAAQKSAKGISDLFDINNSNQDLVRELQGVLSHSGILQEGLKRPYEIIANPSKITITGETDEVKIAQAKKLIANVHSIVTSKMQYGKISDVSIDVPYSAIMGGSRSLNEYLGTKGMRTSPGIMEQFNSFTTNYILRDKIKDSNLDMNHMDFITSLMTVKETPFVQAAGKKGKVFGWKISKAEAGPGANSTLRTQVGMYNKYVDEILEASQTKKGALVVEATEKAVIINDAVGDYLVTSMHYNMEGSHTMAKQTITHFLNALDMSHGAFKMMVSEFVSGGNSKNAVRLLQWLKAHKIITRVDTENTTRYSLNADKAKFIKDDIIKALTAKMNRFGISRQETERLMQSAQQAVDDMQFRGFGGETKDARLTRDQFFTKYFPGDESIKTGEGQVAELETTIYRTELEPGVPGYELESSKYIRKDAVNRLLDRMTVEMNGVDIPVMNIVNLPGGMQKLKVARDDAMHMFLTVTGSSDRTFFTFNNGNLRAQSKNVANTDLYKAYDDIGITHIPILATNQFFYVTPEGAMRNGRFSIFDGPSEYLPTETATILRDNLRNLTDSLNSLDRIDVKNSRSEPIVFDTGTEGGDRGLVLMRIADSVQPFAMLKSDLPKIVQRYEEFMTRLTEERATREAENKSIINSSEWNQMKEDLNRLKRNVEEELGFAPEHERALRALLFHKLTASSKDGSFFIDLMNGSEDAVKAAKRFQLFHTPQMRETMRGVASNALLIGGYERTIANYFDKKGTAGVVIWNDTKFADIFNNLSPENQAFWTEHMYDRDSASMFDSISFVSRQFRDYTALSHGMSSNADARIIKPVISSNGEVLLYGKTVFVYDPALESFFKNNPNVDIVSTASSSKIYGKEQWKMIEKDSDGVINSRNLEAEGYVQQLPLSAIRVKSDRVKDIDYGAVSQQLYNYMDSNEAGEVFNKMYDGKLRLAIDDMSDLVGNPLKMRQFFSDNVYDNAFVESMIEAGGGTQVLGALRTWADFGNPMELGENAVMSQVYRKMIDPVIKQKSEIGSIRYGGKAVLMQSLYHKDINLRFTKVTSDGKVEQYGEIILPFQDQYEPIKDITAREKGMKIKLLDTETNKLVDAEDRMGELWNRATTLGDLHDFVDGGKYQIAIVTTRYPRTRPNDLAILGLRGFGVKESGNTSIINSLDVLNIFEGDYDVDKTDYFWMKSDVVFKHIQDSKNRFVQGIDPDKAFPSNIDGLGFYKNNAQEENKLWHRQIANSSVLGRGLGVVQKVPRIINHLRDVAEPRQILDAEGKPTDKTEYVLMESKDGSQKIVIDYNNKDWFQRMVLEAQTIIDAGSSVNKKIMDQVYEWRDEFIFPLISGSQSISWGNIAGKKNPVGFLAKLNKGDSEGRVRIFRKYDLRRELGKQEVDLNEVDRDIVRAMMKNYSDFLQLGTNVYDNSGKGKSPSYQDVLDVGGQYFKFMGDLSNNIYWKLHGKHRNDEDFKNYWGTRDAPKIPTKKAEWKMKQFEDFKPHPIYDFYSLPTRKTGPFTQAVQDKAKGIHNGKAGNIFDRIMFEVWDKDPIKANEYRALSADETFQMEQAMMRFYGPKGYKALDEFTSGILFATSSIKKSQSYLRYLKKQFGIVSKLRISEKMKREKREELNTAMKEAEDRIYKLASEKYKKTKRAADIREPLVKFLDVTDKDVQDGAVQMYTMNAITNVLGTKDIPAMRENINQLRAFEQAAFLDITDMSHTMSFGEAKTFLSESQRTYLSRFFNDSADVYDIIDHYLEAGVSKWGFSYLYNYGAPLSHKNAIGIFNGVPVPISYGPTKRFNRAMQFMANKAASDPDYRNALKQVAPIVDYYRQYFQKDTRHMAEDLLIDPSTGLNYEMLKFPKFQKSLQGVFDNYTDTKWTKATGKTNPFQIFDDKMVGFYREVFRMNNMEAEFDSYMQQMNYLNATLMENDAVNPFQYLNMMNNLESKVHSFMEKGFAGGISPEGRFVPTDALRNNPIWMLLGGEKHIKGISMNPRTRASDGKLRMQGEVSKQSIDLKNQGIHEGRVETERELWNACKGK